MHEDVSLAWTGSARLETGKLTRLCLRQSQTMVGSPLFLGPVCIRTGRGILVVRELSLPRYQITEFGAESPQRFITKSLEGCRTRDACPDDLSP
jgi:hypothetical protein